MKVLFVSCSCCFCAEKGEQRQWQPHIQWKYICFWCASKIHLHKIRKTKSFVWKFSFYSNKMKMAKISTKSEQNEWDGCAVSFFVVPNILSKKYCELFRLRFLCTHIKHNFSVCENCQFIFYCLLFQLIRLVVFVVVFIWWVNVYAFGKLNARK